MEAHLASGAVFLGALHCRGGWKGVQSLVIMTNIVQIGSTVPAIGEVAVLGSKPTGTPSNSLEAALEGVSGALLIFWSSACSHCMRYDSFLRDLPERYPDIASTLVAARQGEHPEPLQRALTERALTLQLWLDPDGRLSGPLGVRQTPTALLVDSSRRLLYRGAIDNFRYPNDADYRPYLAPALDAFLAGEPIPREQTAAFGCPIASPYYAP